MTRHNLPLVLLDLGVSLARAQPHRKRTHFCVGDKWESQWNYTSAFTHMSVSLTKHGPFFSPLLGWQSRIFCCEPGAASPAPSGFQAAHRTAAMSSSPRTWVLPCPFLVPPAKRGGQLRLDHRPTFISRCFFLGGLQLFFGCFSSFGFFYLVNMALALWSKSTASSVLQQFLPTLGKVWSNLLLGPTHLSFIKACWSLLGLVARLSSELPKRALNRGIRQGFSQRKALHLLKTEKINKCRELGYNIVGRPEGDQRSGLTGGHAVCAMQWLWDGLSLALVIPTPPPLNSATIP